MPSPAKLKKIQELLDKFATGSMNYAGNRISLPREQGGLGLFNLENFLMAQQAGWILKAKKSSRDNWRAKLRSLCYNNVLCAGPALISETANPILHNLATSYERIRIAHDSLHSNFTEACIVNNKLFFRGPGDKNVIDNYYLESNENDFRILASLPAREFFNVNGIKTRLEINMDFRINLSIESYVKLANCINHFVRRMRPQARNNGSRISFADNFLSLKRPGKKLRESLTKKKKNELDASKIKAVVSFCSLVGLTPPAKEKVVLWLSLWNSGGLNNRVRTFMFKFYNNLLGLNTRLSHFVANQNRGCTFCAGNGTTIPDESFIHIYLECPTTFEWHNQFLKKYLPHLTNMEILHRTGFFFFGKLPDAANENIFLILSVLILQYCIWEEKLRKKKPSFYTIDLHIGELIKTITDMNKKVFISAEKLNLPLCRLAGIQNFYTPPPVWMPAPTIPRRRP
jgi:hypothetical protein